MALQKIKFRKTVNGKEKTVTLQSVYSTVNGCFHRVYVPEIRLYLKFETMSDAIGQLKALGYSQVMNRRVEQ